MLTVGSLFSGIGGLELGFENTGGFRTVWFSEIEPFSVAILKKWWGDVPNLGDITKVDWDKVERPDVLVGGFPCQDISNAGKRRGIGGERSGLWKEYVKAISILRPRFAVMENVAALINRGLDVVLGDLAEAGYNAEWRCLSASQVGAWHKRDRIFIIAYPNSDKFRCLFGKSEEQSNCTWINACCGFGKVCDDVSNSESIRYRRRNGEGRSDGKEWFFQEEFGRSKVGGEVERCSSVLSNSNLSGLQEFGWEKSAGKKQYSFKWGSWWKVEPEVGRVVDGISKGLDSFIWKERIKALGNAVVPQVAEVIARRVLELDKCFKEVL